MLILPAMTYASSKKDLPPVPEKYFSDWLSGSRTDYDSPARFTKLETEALRADIWASWVKANDNFTEEKLQPVIPMSWEGAGEWNIPADLEPDAKMKYYWCSRGPAMEHGYRTFIYLHGSGNPDREWQNGLILSSQFQDSSAFFVPKIPNTVRLQFYLMKIAAQFLIQRILLRNLNLIKLNTLKASLTMKL